VGLVWNHHTWRHSLLQHDHDISDGVSHITFAQMVTNLLEVVFELVSLVGSLTERNSLRNNIFLPVLKEL